MVILEDQQGVEPLDHGLKAHWQSTPPFVYWSVVMVGESGIEPHAFTLRFYRPSVDTIY